MDPSGPKDPPAGQAVVLIPAWKPGGALISLARILVDNLIPVVIVDDGSGPEYQTVFAKVASFTGVAVLRHAVNLGKGAALKTGINFILAGAPDTPGIVTADADGQHHPEDILQMAARVRETPGALIMGVRSFGSATPLRSRFGNQITKSVMRVLVGKRLSDTQTGLRAIPNALLPRLLKIPASGYEFELEMLLAAKHLGTHVVEQPVRTIYEAGNPTSHFQPLRDSMRIYLVLLRFSLISVFSAALDNSLFYLGFALSGNLFGTQVAARAISILFNYAAVRKAAFHSDAPHETVLPQYLTLAAANLILSWCGIRLITAAFPVGVFAAKLAAETLLFAANFAIQRDVVFTRRTRTGVWRTRPATLTAHGVAR